MRTQAVARLGAALAVVSIGSTGCAMGLQDLPVGGVGNAFTVNAELETADGLVNGADVRSGQKAVGRVSDIALVDGHAQLTLSLDEGTSLPANVGANVEIPSALGTPFVRLIEPQTPKGTLTSGSTIPLARTTVGPQIEGTLAALGEVLGGSGMVQLESVISSLNTAFENRSDKVGDLIDTMNRLLARTSRHTEDFNAAMAAAADVTTALAEQRNVVNDFLSQTPAAVNVLASQRDHIARLMSQTTSLARNVDAITKGRQDTLNSLVGDAHSLITALGSFNNNVGQTLAHMNTFMSNFSSAVRGDYLVFDGALDIPGGIDKILTGGIFGSGQPLPTPKELRDVLTGGLLDPKSDKPQSGKPQSGAPKTSAPKASAPKTSTAQSGTTQSSTPRSATPTKKDGGR